MHCSVKLFFALSLLSDKAPQYTDIICKESNRQGVDPFIVSAVIWRESRFFYNACAKGDHGLMQIHLEPKSCLETMDEAKALGLYRPRVNIREGVGMLAYWKKWVKTNNHLDHDWLLNYNQGYGKCPPKKPYCSAEERRPHTKGHVGGYGNRVRSLAAKLKRKAWQLERLIKEHGTCTKE